MKKVYERACLVFDPPEKRVREKPHRSLDATVAADKPFGKEEASFQTLLRQFKPKKENDARAGNNKNGYKY